MRRIEDHICLQVAGSKNQARKNLFNFAKIKENSNLLPTLNAIIHPDLQNVIARLKDAGDKMVHHQPPPTTLVDLESLLAGEDDPDRTALMGFVRQYLFHNGILDLTSPF